MSEDFQELFEKAGERHGHLCPSLCFAVRGSLLIQRIGQERGIKSDSVLVEATSKCMKDGVMTVLGDDNVEFSKTPGVCRLTLEDGERKARITLKDDIRAKVGAIAAKHEADTEKYQEEGLAFLAPLPDDDLFQIE